MAATLPDACSVTMDSLSSPLLPGQTTRYRQAHLGANHRLAAPERAYPGSRPLRSGFMAVDQGVARSPSLYRKVAEDIKAAIAAGGYAAGTRLPSESELAGRYSVS